MDNEKFISQHDVIYETRPRIWQDGLPLGNGFLGTLAYAPFHPEWVINKNDVWDYRHPKFKRFTVKELEEIKRKNLSFIETLEKENIADLEKFPCPKSCGILRMRFGHPSIYTPGHRITMRLSLFDGMLRTNLDKHLSHPRITSFVHSRENLLCVRVKDVSHMVAFHNYVDLFRVVDSALPPARPQAEKDTIWLEQNFPDGFRYVMMARIVPKDGHAYEAMFKRTVRKFWWKAAEPSKEVKAFVEGDYAVVPVAGDFDLFLTVVTSFDDDDPLRKAKEVLGSAVRRGFETLYQSHRPWWREFWAKSSVEMDDKFLEQLWYCSLYNLATTLRGVPAPGLCGLWYGPMDTPSQVLPWMGYYTNDYNAQLAVKPVFRVNHSELSDGYFQTLLKQLPQAQRNAKEVYGMPGAYYALATDPTGEEITNGPYRLCQCSGPYWGVILWWRYLYTRDKEFLRDVAYPILRDVATFFANYMRFDEEEGVYHLVITQPPEYMSLEYSDPPFTTAPLRVTFKAAIAAAKMFEVDSDLIAKWQHVLDHFPPYPEADGILLEARGFPPDHWPGCGWHFPFFPCAEMDPEIDASVRQKLVRSFERAYKFAGTYAVARGRHMGWTGGFHHIGMPAIWLGLKGPAKKLLEDSLKHNLKPSGLISHNPAVWAPSKKSEANLKNIPDLSGVFEDCDEPLPAREWMTGRLNEECTEAYEFHETMFPALEGPAQYLLAMGEMMLQSQNGIIRLFPCIVNLKAVSFRDFLAEGAVLVSSAWEKGAVKFVTLKSLKGGTVRIKNPWKGKNVLLCRSGSSGTKRLAGGRYLKLILKRGEVIAIAPSARNLREGLKPAPQRSEAAAPRKKVFSDGTACWIGKPEPSDYSAWPRLRDKQDNAELIE